MATLLGPCSRPDREDERTAPVVLRFVLARSPDSRT